MLKYFLEKEDYYGNTEYKRYLIDVDNIRLEELATQMKWRLVEGDGEAIYYFGVEDNGMPYLITKQELDETLKNFNLLLEKNNAKIINYEEIDIYYKITIRIKKNILPEIRIVLLGNSNTGKTTFLSNILLDKIDNNGNARLYLLNHKHEIITKRTSSINCYSIDYNNYTLSFLEAPGHEKYIRTKYKILLGTNPHIILLFDDNNINICQELNLPYIKINKTDYNCDKLINKNKLFDNIINNYKVSNSIKNNNNVIFNIINTFPTKNNNIIVFGYLKSGNLEINKNIYWMKNNKYIKFKIKSIYFNSEPLVNNNNDKLLTVCLYKKNNNYCLKNGILTNKKLKIINKIVFNNLDKINNIFYCENKIVYLSSIKIIYDKNNNLLIEANVNNYYDTDNNLLINNNKLLIMNY
jgi:GTPase